MITAAKHTPHRIRPFPDHVGGNGQSQVVRSAEPTSICVARCNTSDPACLRWPLRTGMRSGTCQSDTAKRSGYSSRDGTGFSHTRGCGDPNV